GLKRSLAGCKLSQVVWATLEIPLDKWMAPKFNFMISIKDPSRKRKISNGVGEEMRHCYSRMLFIYT
ncbi:unnamed protein product, partial [Sphenostylis stenocarpa]